MFRLQTAVLAQTNHAGSAVGACRVIGWLYSLWRILLALLIMLLYSVAALDRSLLHTAKVGHRGSSPSK
jgi:hypothetical protein